MTLNKLLISDKFINHFLLGFRSLFRRIGSIFTDSKRSLSLSHAWRLIRMMMMLIMIALITLGEEFVELFENTLFFTNKFLHKIFIKHLLEIIYLLSG